MTSSAPRIRQELEPDKTPTGDVFLMLAEELERTRALGLRIEGAICGIAIRSSIDDALVSELQHLDAVLQQIAALRDYMTEISKRCGPDQSVETSSALDRVTLAEVRSRLAGGYCRDNPDDHWEML